MATYNGASNSFIDPLNKYSNSNNFAHTLSLLQHLFPCQFKKPFLRSQTDCTDAVASLGTEHVDRPTRIALPTTENALRLPKRLRGEAFELTRKLQVRHKKCAYAKLLEHYCPRPSCQYAWDGLIPHFSKLALSLAQVSAFCRAVIRDVFPKDLFGEKAADEGNWSAICHKIDQFIRLRRFETMSLQDVMQHIKPTKIQWLRGPQKSQSAAPMSWTDSKKRLELLAELLYWTMDSFVIPLLRYNFYVTESATHRNRLFYFRQDVWIEMSQRARAGFKGSMLCKVCAPCELG